MSDINTTTHVVESKPTSIRWFGGGLVFIICMIAYLDRAVFSVTAQPVMHFLNITPVQFGLVTTLFNIGYFIFQIPGGILLEKYGTRTVLTLSLVFWSVFTLLTGMVNSLMMLMIVRFFFGIGESPVFPAGNKFFANWFPADERGKANSLMNGGAFMASIIGPPVVVLVVGHFGWQSAFFLCGALGVVISIVWFVCMRNTPAQHKSVNAAELNKIRQGNEISTVKQKVPWKILLRQRSFWAIAAAFFGTLWTIQFFMYWLPYYLQSARHLSFKDMGFYSSIPFIFIVVSVFLAGIISDLLIRKGFSRFFSRNVVCIAGLILSVIGLIASTKAQTTTGNILWLSVALGGAGFAQTLAWSIATDIGREFTSVTGSWMNTWGFIAASIVPTVAPLVANHYGWNAVLLLNAVITLIGILGFLFIKADSPLVAQP
ncbi:MAG: MFS transporter [Enterobacterales bacterium endosymbiont of Blomia tropicalis]|uniref:MFS transporter n=1 Tax=Mixta mediterraneensis TaxID=2758443 RepID=UPI0025A7FF4A|nr:MFS transporter [Mixta mediterraneensis]MDL4915550.1 MFS transporter [Mixta mediterraneensis]